MLNDRGYYYDPVNMLIYTTGGERMDFPEIRTNVPSEFSLLFYNMIPLNIDGCFIGISYRNIVTLNLNTNTYNVVGLNENPNQIYAFKEYANGVYSFIVTTKTWVGGNGPSFLCLWEYQPEMSAN